MNGRKKVGMEDILRSLTRCFGLDLKAPVQSQNKGRPGKDEPSCSGGTWTGKVKSASLCRWKGGHKRAVGVQVDGGADPFGDNELCPHAHPLPAARARLSVLQCPQLLAPRPGRPVPHPRSSTAQPWQNWGPKPQSSFLRQQEGHHPSGALRPSAGVGSVARESLPLSLLLPSLPVVFRSTLQTNSLESNPGLKGCFEETETMKKVYRSSSSGLSAEMVGKECLHVLRTNRCAPGAFRHPLLEEK